MAGPSDVERLEELLVTEQRLISLYEAGIRRGVIDPALARELLGHEREHARALEGVLARAGHRNPRATVPSPGLTEALRSRNAFARSAYAGELAAAEAYGNAAAAIGDPKLRQPLGSIMACEAAHMVALRDALGEELGTHSLVD
jgi:demethoxyubiquinone hydroxylase (CLK1/Coq7/Cat5 family)